MARRLMGFFAFTMAVLCASAAFAEIMHARTPDDVLERMNGILSYEDEDGAEPFAVMVDFDDAGGFDFCAMDGERRLEMGYVNAFIRGRLDEEGRVSELNLVMHPRRGFCRPFARQADRLSRVYLFSLFGELTDVDLALLMDSYLYDIRPYSYNPGDRSVRARERMCEIELGGEVVRVESAAVEDNTLTLNVAFLYEPDGTTRERASENGWRIRRLSQAVSECEMIQTCADCLIEFESDGIGGDEEDIAALLELAGQSAAAIGGMETEHMHAQEVFLIDLQEMCAQLTVWTGEYDAALAAGDIDTARLRLQDICRISSEIGRMPETLH